MTDETATQDTDSPFVSVHKTELGDLEQKAQDLEQLSNLLLDLFDGIGLGCRTNRLSDAPHGQEIIEIDLPLGFSNLSLYLKGKDDTIARAEKAVEKAQDLAEDCKDALADTTKVAETAERQLLIERKAYIAALQQLTDERDEFESRFMQLAERFFALVSNGTLNPNGE
ncbi:MAG: hypothetical protein ACXABY_20625 [Candidatus Thorarchaeota archaeon]|jgi:hypothetical protein